jgi:hypothetical protein
MHGDACERTDSTSAEDTADESSDLTEQNTEDGEVLEVAEGNEKQGNEEEGNEEDGTVPNDDTDHSVIVVASGRPRHSRL